MEPVTTKKVFSNHHIQKRMAVPNLVTRLKMAGELHVQYLGLLLQHDYHYSCWKKIIFLVHTSAQVTKSLLYLCFPAVLTTFLIFSVNQNGS